MIQACLYFILQCIACFDFACVSVCDFNVYLTASKTENWCGKEAVTTEENLQGRGRKGSFHHIMFSLGLHFVIVVLDIWQ